MQTQDFENAVADMARRQAERLRGMGYHFAAAEVDALMPNLIEGEDFPPEALIARGWGSCGEPCGMLGGQPPSRSDIDARADPRDPARSPTRR